MTWGCCAVAFTALFIIIALASVVGVSVYLAMITNLHKTTLIPMSGRLKVEKGDDFSVNLFNASSKEFISKANKYETIVSGNFLIEIR